MEKWREVTDILTYQTGHTCSLGKRMLILNCFFALLNSKKKLKTKKTKKNAKGHTQPLPTISKAITK